MVNSCRINSRGTRTLLLLVACITQLAHAAAIPVESQTQTSLAQDTGLATWETATNNVHLRLTQISPEQARAFMQARGLDEKSVNEFARTCVYMMVLRNDSKLPIKYCMAEWRYTPHIDTGRYTPQMNAARYIPNLGTPQLMLGKHDWQARWQPRKLAKSVKLAFDWSQFPFEQTFSPGDWNQGMTTFELPAGSRFDLLYRWWQDGKLYQGTLRDVQCPASFD